MPRQLKFFGLTLSETGATGRFGPPNPPPAGITIPNPASTWNVALDAATGLLNVRLVLEYGRRTRLSLNLMLNTAVADGIVTIADGTHHGSDNNNSWCQILSPVVGDPRSGAGLSLVCGPLRLSGNPLGGWAQSTGGRLRFGFNWIGSFYAGTETPWAPIALAMSDIDDAQFVELADAAAAQVTILAGAIDLQTGTPVYVTPRDPFDPPDFFNVTRTHHIEAVTIDLARGDPELPLFFTGDAAGLPLHAEPKKRTAFVASGNPLYVPLTATNHRIRLQLRREDEVDPLVPASPTVVRGMALHPTTGARLSG
jgi:hypothetical protein